MKNFFKKIKNLWRNIVERAEDNTMFTAVLALYVVLVETFKVLCYTPWSPIGGTVSGFVGYLSALGTGLVLGLAAFTIIAIFAGWFTLMRGLIVADELGLY